MFSFNFGSSKKEECSSSDDEVDPSPEVKVTEDFVNIYTSQNDCIKLKNKIEIKIVSKENLLSSLKKHTDSNIQEAENSNSDLLPGVYEGGLKVWECTFDLVQYILDESNSVSFENKAVLDLGCGAGILGILAKNLGAKIVDFQDYNEGVLKHLTIPNVLMNFSNISDIRFWSGDWGGFKPNCLYDIILTSETIYNPKSYKKLHKLFKENLKPSGVIFLAAKLYYFGVGGSLSEFCEFIEHKGIFTYKNLLLSEEGVKRAIILIQFKN